MKKIVWLFLGSLSLIGCNQSGGTNQNAAANQLLAGRYADVDIVTAAPGMWRIFYGVEPATPNNKLEIYSALSTDGLTWAAQPTPILQWATFPDIIKLPDDRFRLYYQDAQQHIIASAISTDGVTFLPEAGARLTPSGQDDSAGVAAPTVLLLPDGSYLLVYRADEAGAYSATAINPKTTALFVAHSPDGLNFMVGEKIVDGRNPTFDGYIDGPELVLLDDGKVHVRFWTSAGKDNTADAGQYDMVSDDFGATWSQPTLFYPSQASGITGGDPTYAKINDQWYMFYTRPGEGIFAQAL